jgi:hypothetical protein
MRIWSREQTKFFMKKNLGLQPALAVNAPVSSAFSGPWLGGALDPRTVAANEPPRLCSRPNLLTFRTIRAILRVPGAAHPCREDGGLGFAAPCIGLRLIAARKLGNGAAMSAAVASGGIWEFGIWECPLGVWILVFHPYLFPPSLFFFYTPYK